MGVPVLVTTSPLDAATDHKIDAAISFVFSEALDPTTVNDSTVFLIDEISKDEVRTTIVLSSDAKTIHMLPFKALYEEHHYRAVAVGAGSGFSTLIRSSTSAALASTASIYFRTAKERYVALSEVVSRDDIDSIGPIRAVESTLPPGMALTLATSSLSLVSSSPPSYSSRIDRCIDEISLTFSKAVNPTGIANYVHLETNHVLDYDVWYGAEDGDGTVWPKLMTGEVPSGVTLPTYVQPTGTISVAGEVVTWTRGTGEPCFLYNTEVMLIADHGLLALDGTELGEDVAVILTTTLFPLYAGVRAIRLELGPTASVFMDDAINRIAYRWSVEALEKAAWLFPMDNPYPAVRRFVVYSTVLSLLDDLVGSMSVKGAGASKVLGDLQIKYGSPEAITKSPFYVKALGERGKAEDELRAYRGQRGPRFVVKGYPSFDARGWQRITGGTYGYNLDVDRNESISPQPLTIFVSGPRNGGLFKATRNPM